MNNQNWIIDETIFKHPFTCILAGPTGAGKTVLLQQILEHKNKLIDKIPEKIVYCYKSWQPAYDQINLATEDIEFVQGFYNVELFDKSKNNMIIIDDLMNECENSSEIKQLFAVDSHHSNISVFLISQNIFPKGKCARDISLNSNYLIIFNSPRDMNQISVLGRQMYPDKSKFFMEAYNDATNNKGHSYLFIDLKQKTEDRNRIQTGIIPGNQRIIYTTK
jgi:hypothetical protein